MEYKDRDIEKISSILCGEKRIDIPDDLYLDEGNLYEICLDMGVEADFMYEKEISLYKQTKMLLLKCALYGKFEEFIDYYMEIYLNKYVHTITRAGYSFLQIKDNIIRYINSLWSITEKHFAYMDGGWKIDNVKFKEYDMLGEGGFSTVYRCNPLIEPLRVYKVLNEREKSCESSVYRFRREYGIMQKHNESGYTIKVYDFNESELVYSMEYADMSLEEYIESGKIKEGEKDEIIKRCVECMMYLHDKGVIHRDFHPGNILLNKDKYWVATDFGLAKDISDKYSRQTTTTHAVGRFWFTDPVQLEALKEGTVSTDMYSLARTIDYIMNENKSGKVHKYSSIIYKVTSPEIELRYGNIHDMYEDIINIMNRTTYESSEETANRLVEDYKRTNKYNITSLIDIFTKEDKGEILWLLVLEHENVFIKPYIEIVGINPMVGLNIIKEANDYMQNGYKNWNDYDKFANWAYSVLKNRKHIHDEINVQLADIIEYVSNRVGRFAIKPLSNIIKKDTSVDSHIRAMLTYQEGY